MAPFHPVSALNLLFLNQILTPMALASQWDQMDPELCHSPFDP